MLTQNAHTHTHPFKDISRSSPEIYNVIFNNTKHTTAATLGLIVTPQIMGGAAPPGRQAILFPHRATKVCIHLRLETGAANKASLDKLDLR